MSLNPENTLIRKLELFCNLIALNLIFLLTCLPVITIGSAVTSLYHVTLRECRGEYGYFVRPYLTAFRSNLRSGIKLFSTFLITGLLLLVDYFYWKKQGTLLAAGISIFLIFLLVIWYLIMEFSFAINARFKADCLSTIRNACGICLSHPGISLLSLLIDLAVLLLALLANPIFLLILLSGFSLRTYLKSTLLVRIFRPYETTTDTAP